MPFLIRRTGNPDAWAIPAAQTPSAPLQFKRELFFPLACGYDLTDELLSKVPDPYTVVGSPSADLPDIFGNDTIGPWHVSERVRQTISNLEPGRHNFLQVNAIRGDGNNTPCGNYYILHTSRVVDAVVFERTDFQGGGGASNRAFGSAAISRSGTCVLAANAIGSSHLWRGGLAPIDAPQALWAHYFASDELVSRLNSMNATGWAYQKCDLDDDRLTGTVADFDHPIVTNGVSPDR